MCHRSLPARQAARRAAIFATLGRSIVLLTDEMLRARGVPIDDPELTAAELSVDAFLAAIEDYDARYWHAPYAFTATPDAEQAEIILVRAAYAVDQEIDYALAQRTPIEDEPIIPIRRAGRQSAGHNFGYGIIEIV